MNKSKQKKKSREEKCRDFRDKYWKKMGYLTKMTLAKKIVVENLCNLHELVEPEMIPRPEEWRKEPYTLNKRIWSKILGRFRDHKMDRKCVTADKEIIRFYRKELNKEPPCFVEAGPRQNLRHDRTKVNIGIVTAGGLAPGLNTIVETLVKRHILVYGLVIGDGRIYGFQNGFEGLEEDDHIELDIKMVEGWSHYGGSMLGSGRSGRGEEYTINRFKTLDKLGIDILYIVGGNGSQEAAYELANYVKSKNRNISIAHIPKTMDNDILWVWQSFGFVTAYEEASKIIDILHIEAASTSRICLIQIFGANSGHVAANAALASGNVDAVLIPEVPYESKKVYDFIRERYQRNKVHVTNPHAVIVMAQGAQEIKKNNGNWELSESDTDEAKDNNFINFFNDLKEELNKIDVKVFYNQPKHVIRSVPPNSHDQVYCRRLAEMAVDSCLAGYTNFTISSRYTEYVIVPMRLSVGEDISEERFKSFPTAGMFWKSVVQNTRQPLFLSEDALKFAKLKGYCEGY